MFICLSLSQSFIVRQRLPVARSRGVPKQCDELLQDPLIFDLDHLISLFAFSVSRVLLLVFLLDE